MCLLFCVFVRFPSGSGEYNESLRGISPIVAWTFQRVKLSSREMPAVLHSHLCCGAAHAPEESSCRFLPFANQANLPARLIVSDVNYRMCAFVHSGACCHDDLCSRKY